MSDPRQRRVLALVNPKSGLWWSFDALRRGLDASWDVPANDLSYQFCQSVEDSLAKTRRAIAQGVDTILVVGDGTVNSIGRELIGTDTELGIIPVGSGNGFARHFGIPLSAEKAVHALAGGSAITIDVGMVDERPFLVTCSMAWDGAIARSFAKSPVRGIIPYIFAGVQEFFEYDSQNFTVVLDGAQELTFKAPMLFTVANLSEYGGGARIAPQAEPDDGYLELVVALKQDAPKLIANIGRLFDGSINRIPEVSSYRFRELEIIREQAASIQIDGELVDAPERLRVGVRPSCLKVIVPER